MINFRAINEDNFDAVIRMKRPDNEHFVASNAYSLAQAWLYRDAGDVFPFAIYNDDEPVGFMMGSRISADSTMRIIAMEAGFAPKFRPTFTSGPE